MVTEVVMPQMGESITEGTITKWLKDVGDYVERDEPLLEISTEKVDAEIPSPAAGFLHQILFPIGATVPINQVIAIIGQRIEEPSTVTLNKQGAKIFISYRRDDAEGQAGRLYDGLCDHFGREQIFMDVDSIEGGEDFVEVIQREVGCCNVLIAVIGKTWLNCTDSAGQRRLDNPEDFVRLEIETALERNIRVIPVLVQGAAMPNSLELPEPVAKLARRHALELSRDRWQHDVERLTQVLKKIITFSSK